MNYTPVLETDRLIIRPITIDDLQAYYEMDSQPEVHTFLRAAPLQSLDETKDVINALLEQYEKFGVARVAVIEKETNQFIGWTGFKFIEEKEAIDNKFDYLDFGYRFRKEAWGKGYATEAAKACMDYYKNNMTHFKLNAITHVDNSASRHVLEKIGFEVTHSFPLVNWGIECYWYELK
ncbi:GNAT family N-acetyltransferase [Chishuiella sp.]|uniref:GNAT family N-acetyltransferase n=1 Tax=Chishuiella sp. TaxID=1969467 RepID=UPI0028A9815C|nr:GNAT family N-acetyltransferase [Chishuiella sp.]